MSDCAICDDPRIQAIDAALDAKRAPNLVRYQFRLEPQKLQWHIAHRALESVDVKSKQARQVSPIQGFRVPDDNTLGRKDQEPQFRTAWQAMDTPARQRTLPWLQEQRLGVDWGA